MLDIEGKKILVLAPHTDDAEFGMGGTINKWVESGAHVHCAAFSACTQSITPDLPADILIHEIKAASGVLGIKNTNLHLFEYNVRTFSSFRQQILDNLIELRNSINPDIICIPSLQDVHQDHQVIANEAVRAFKFKTILSYELPWNNFTFSHTCFIVLSEPNVNKKIEAIELYVSQKDRIYANSDFIRSLARTRGVQINAEYAECFEIVRLVQ